MNPRKAFSYYHGFHLHFMNEKYSILKYGTQTTVASKAFDKLPGGIKYKYDWVSNNFQTTQNIVYACIGNELKDLDIKFGNKQEILDNYIEYKKRRESISYVLKEEYTKYMEKGEFKFHQLIFNYLASIYSPEFVLLMDHETDNLIKVLDSPQFSFARPKLLKLIKYKSFFSPVNYLTIKNHEEHIPA
jgi:hypothetical protein